MLMMITVTAIGVLVIAMHHNTNNDHRISCRGGHYCNLTIDNRVTNHRSQYMYSGIYGPRSVFSECCQPLISCKNEDK